MLRMNFGIQNNRRFSSKSKIEGWLFFGEIGKNEKIKIDSTKMPISQKISVQS